MSTASCDRVGGSSSGTVLDTRNIPPSDPTELPEGLSQIPLQKHSNLSWKPVKFELNFAKIQDKVWFNKEGSHFLRPGSYYHISWQSRGLI